MWTGVLPWSTSLCKVFCCVASQLHPKHHSFPPRMSTECASSSKPVTTLQSRVHKKKKRRAVPLFAAPGPTDLIVTLMSDLIWRYCLHLVFTFDQNIISLFPSSSSIRNLNLIFFPAKNLRESCYGPSPHRNPLQFEPSAQALRAGCTNTTVWCGKSASSACC